MQSQKELKRWLLAAVLVLCGSSGLAQPARQSEPTNRITLPFSMSRGNVVVKTTLNEMPISAMVDTGYDMTMVHPDVAEKLGLSKRREMTIVGIAGEEPADVFEGAKFAFGEMTYDPRRVAAIRAEKGRRGWEGILGSGFFRRFVVEFRPAAKALTLHEPETFEHKGEGTIVPLQFRRRSTTPLIDAEIRLAGDKSVIGRFELDTGCDSGLCLGKDFVHTNHLIEASSTTHPGGRRGVGGGARSVEGVLPELRLGTASVPKPEANFFTEGSPVDSGLAGHIGWGILRTFEAVII